jgi:DNA-binding NarL/FixJ family response regulator
MIRVVVVDDHPALRAGLRTVLEAEPGIVFVGESNGSEESVWPTLERCAPDLVLLDYHLPRGDGLQICYRIKQRALAPRIVLYSAYAKQALAVPAALARADALVDKGLGALDLFEVIRLVHRGERVLPPLSPGVLDDAMHQLDSDDHALVGMLLDGSSEAEVATTLRVETRDVRHAVQRILSRLRLEVPAAGG